MFAATLLFLGLSYGRQVLSTEVAETLGRRNEPAYKNCSAVTRTGYLKNTAGQYLTCTNTACNWQAFSETATQLFRQVASDRRHRRGLNQDSTFEIYSPSGAPTGQCLNTFRQGWGAPEKLRMASCNLRGSKNWNICDGYLAVDRMRTCVQSNAQMARCDQSHEVVTLESPQCLITSTTIDNLVCLSPVTGGGCAATGFDAGTMAGASSQSDCDACNAAKGSTQQCSFSFAYTTQNTITQSWQNAFTWDIGVKFSLSEKFQYGSATEGMTFSFSDTLTKGHSKTISTTMQDTTGCSVSLEPGTRESATANYLVGTIHADFNATVTRHYSCNTGTKKAKSYVKTMTLTITNVPTQKIVGTCTTNSKGCPSNITSRLAGLAGLA